MTEQNEKVIWPVYVDVYLTEDGHSNNLDRANETVQTIQELKAIQVALKNAFAHMELDGGPTAALQHPLYLQAQAAILRLEESLTLLI